MEKPSFEKLVRPLVVLIYVALIVLAVHVFVKYLFLWFLPFFIGFVVSRPAIPLARRMTEKLKLRRGFSSAISSLLMVLGALVLVAGLAYVIGLWIVPYIKRVFATLSGTMEQLTATWASLVVTLDDVFPPEMSKGIQDAIASLPTKFDLMGTIVKPVINVAGSLPMIIFSVVVTPLSAFFFTRYHEPIVVVLKGVFTESFYEAASRTYHTLISKLWAWLKAQAILCSIDFAVIFAGLLITGVGNAFTAALLIFVIDFLPILGSGLALIPWALIALLMGNYRVAIGVAIVYVLVLVVRNSLEPHVLGSQINMNPFVTLFSIYAGYRLYGFVGMFLLPLTVLVVIQLNDWGYLHLWEKLTPEPEAETAVGKKSRVRILNAGIFRKLRREDPGTPDSASQDGPAGAEAPPETEGGRGGPDRK